LLREQKGLDQGDLGVHSISINRIEQGKTQNPKPETLNLIAGHLDTTADEIFDCVDRLNGALNTEPVDSGRLRLHRMLDGLLDAGEPWSAIKGNIEGMHKGLTASQSESARKQADSAVIQKEAVA